MEKPAVAPRVEASAEGGDPQGTFRVLVERPDFVARKPIGRGEQTLFGPLDSPQPLAVRARPDRPVPAFAQAGHKLDQQKAAGRHAAVMAPAQHAEPARS